MENNLISLIYTNYSDIARVIYSYYGDKHYVIESMSGDMFKEMCEKNFVNKYPSILFNFLERNNIQLGIMCKFVEKHYEYAVKYMDDFRWGNDCESRHEAECRVVMASIEMLDVAMKNGKTMKYLK